MRTLGLHRARCRPPRSIISYFGLAVIILCIYHLFSDGDFSVLMVRREGGKSGGRARRPFPVALLTLLVALSLTLRRRWALCSACSPLCYLL